MNKNKTFRDFLKTLVENGANEALVESAKKAFNVLYESDDVRVSPESVKRESFSFGTTPREVFDAHFDTLLGEDDYPIKPNSSLATFLDKVMQGVRANDRQDGAWMFDSENLWKLLENLKILSVASSEDSDNDFTDEDVEQAFGLRSSILETLKIEEI